MLKICHWFSCFITHLFVRFTLRLEKVVTTNGIIDLYLCIWFGFSNFPRSSVSVVHNMYFYKSRQRTAVFCHQPKSCKFCLAYLICLPSLPWVPASFSALSLNYSHSYLAIYGPESLSSLARETLGRLQNCRLQEREKSD